MTVVREPALSIARFLHKCSRTEHQRNTIKQSLRASSPESGGIGSFHYTAKAIDRRAAICGLLSLESGSMWPCAFLHAAHSNYDQAILDVISRGEDKLSYVSETGIFTIV